LTPEELVNLYESPGIDGDVTPLSGLCLINWASVAHAHGAATDIPALLRALVSNDPDHREHAVLLLFETIWHQGDVYEATPYVILFLFNLLESDGPQDKTAIAQLLDSIADGRPVSAAFHDESEVERMKSERRIMAGIRRAIGVRRATLKVFLRNLNMSDEESKQS